MKTTDDQITLTVVEKAPDEVAEAAAKNADPTAEEDAVAFCTARLPKIEADTRRGQASAG